MSARSWHTCLVVGLLAVLAVPPHSVRAASDADEVAESQAQVKRHRAPWRTLAQRVPSVTHRAFSKAARTELGLQLGLGLSDPFYRYVAPGVTARYHFDESWAVGAFLDYDAAVRTGINVISRGSAVPLPDLNHPNLGVGIEAIWSPLYGKVSWMAEAVSHFDMYLSLGAGFMALHHGSAIGGTFALGQHYILSPRMALKVELREQLYSMARDPAAVSQGKLQSLLMASVGISFFLPETRGSAQP
jgi:outer membrane beta-barrel protein